MSQVKYFIITCSEDSDRMDVRSLCVWGEWGGGHALADTRREAMHRVAMCKKKHQCRDCDAEIHEGLVERTKVTKGQA